MTVSPDHLASESVPVTRKVSAPNYSSKLTLERDSIIPLCKEEGRDPGERVHSFTAAVLRDAFGQVHCDPGLWIQSWWRGQWHPTPVLFPGKSHGQRSLEGCSPWGAEGRTQLSDFTFTFHFHALEKEMATHSSVLAWRIPGTGEPGGLPSMGSHRVRHNWSNLAAAAAWWRDAFPVVWSLWLSSKLHVINCPITLRVFSFTNFNNNYTSIMPSEHYTSHYLSLCFLYKIHQNRYYYPHFPDEGTTTRTQQNSLTFSMVAHYSMAGLLMCVCVCVCVSVSVCMREEWGREMNKVYIYHVACHQAILDV